MEPGGGKARSSARRKHAARDGFVLCNSRSRISVETDEREETRINYTLHAAADDDDSRSLDASSVGS